MTRRAFSALPLLVISTCALADPAIYGFEGYITYRHSVDDSLLSPSFAPGARIVGTVKLDPTRKRWDPEAQQERVWPIIDWRIVAPNGDALKQTWAESSMAVRRSPSEENFSVDNLDFHLVWHSNETGQLPQDLANFDLSALDPNHWDLRVSRADCHPAHCAPEWISRISAHITSLWRQNEQPVVAAHTFDLDANGWSVQSGQWSAANGYFRNSSSLFASIATLASTTEDRYSIDAKMYLEWSAAGNRGGLVYDYVDANNYRGVLLSPAKKNGDGSIQRVGYIEAFEVRNGARRVTGRVDGLRYDFLAHQWMNLGVERIGTDTHVMHLGLPVLTLSQPIQSGAKRAGVIASYNLVRFDEVVFGVTPR